MLANLGIHGYEIELVAKVLPPAPAAEPETAEKKPRKGLFARR